MGDANVESGNGNDDGAVHESKPASDANDNDPNAKLADAGAEGARLGDAMEVDVNQEHANLGDLPEADWIIVPSDYKSQDSEEQADRSKAVAEQEDHPMTDPLPDVQPGAAQMSSEPISQKQHEPTADEIRKWSKSFQTDFESQEESHSKYRENVLAKMAAKNAAGYKMQQQDDEEAEAQGSSRSVRSRKATSQLQGTKDEDTMFFPDSRGSPDAVEKSIARGILAGNRNSDNSNIVKSKAKPRRTKRAPQGTKSGKITKTTAKKNRQRQTLVNFNLNSSAFTREDESDEDDIAPCEATDIKEALRQLRDSISEGDRIDIPRLRRAIDKCGSGKCVPTSGWKWKLAGIICELEHYQVIGVGEMRLKEIEADKADKQGQAPISRGGLLADEMGLGKTVMVLAMIINALMKGRTAKQAAEKRVDKPTLIVCPVALKKQWQNEIQTHVEEPYRGHTIVYKGSMAQKLGITEAFLTSASFVVTTYNEIQNSYPKPPKFETEIERQAWLNSIEFSNKLGQLHRVHWERVILDEAHAIKNYLSRTSQACIALQAKYHWAVTGTPSQNSCEEFYPYFQLVRFPGINSIQDFIKQFVGSGNPEKLQADLATFMIRRKHGDKLFGKPNLTLPPAKKHILFIKFTQLERDIYEVVRRRFIAKVNEEARSNSADSQYNCILTLILRLRQLTSHILLIHDSLTDLLESEDVEELLEIIDSQEQDARKEKPAVASLRTMIHDRAGKAPLDPLTGLLQKPAKGGTIIKHAMGDQHPISFEKGVGMGQSAGHYILSHKQDKAQRRGRNTHLCVACGEVPESFLFLRCGCLYCFDPCISKLSEENKAMNRNADWCRICKDSKVTTEKDPDSRQFREAIGLKGAPLSQYRSAQMVNRWVDHKGDMITSTKLVAIRDQIRRWIHDEPDSKILVYSQFISMLLILCKLAGIESWAFRTYTGQMDQDARDGAVADFRDTNQKVQILLMSLQAGGVGLNIPEASKVIIVDQWWNSSVDDQAFSRAYRRGQTRETTLVKFVVHGSIDAHIYALQQKKDRQLNDVYTGAKRLTTLDLMGLLGKVEIADDGKPYVAETEMSDDAIDGCLNEESDDEKAN